MVVRAAIFVLLIALSMSSVVRAQEAASPDSGSAALKPAPSQKLETSDRPREDYGYRASQFAFIGSTVADLATTWSLPKGWAEGNPLLGNNKGQQLAVSAGLGFIALWQAHRLQSRGYTKASKFCLWMGTALHSSAAGYNMARR